MILKYHHSTLTTLTALNTIIIVTKQLILANYESILMFLEVLTRSE
jgi:hypothetical protein